LISFMFVLSSTLLHLPPSDSTMGIFTVTKMICIRVSFAFEFGLFEYFLEFFIRHSLPCLDLTELFSVGIEKIAVFH